MDAVFRKQLCAKVLRRNALGIRVARRWTRGFSITCSKGAKRKGNIPTTGRVPLDYKPKLRSLPSSPSPASSPATPRATSADKHRRIGLYGAVVVGTCLIGYVSYFAIVILRAPASTVPIDASAQADVSSRYDKTARTFDTSIDLTELSMGMPKKRRELVAEAHGDVLEVSIGTGRNLEYYDWNFKGYNGIGQPSRKDGIKKGKVRSFTAVDKSGEMLEIAHEKFSKMFPGILSVRWVIGDASEALPPPPKNPNERGGNLEGGKYDTIVQTMGLCSANDPVALLKNLANLVKEEDGRILLLEHGRGRWAWLNNVLDNSAKGHAEQHGCWWNRDIAEIVKKSGLEVVDGNTWHAGTTWRLELKKPKQKK
ncbi:S-adenosyl-L-methionine-dependent methyltransferase [Bisporella sp. PMI_857]|nr:S-adenosyl-L-methionine-dependent methyltransferase [Bisporella sp. PMI_857]